MVSETDKKLTPHETRLDALHSDAERLGNVTLIAKLAGSSAVVISTSAAMNFAYSVANHEAPTPIVSAAVAIGSMAATLFFSISGDASRSATAVTGEILRLESEQQLIAPIEVLE